MAANTITEASANASLSADGKTLTIVATGAEFFKDRYTVKVLNNVKTTGDVAFPTSATSITVNDTTRPTLSGVSYSNHLTAVVKFSEKLADPGTVTFELADGTSIATPVATLVNGNIQVDLTAVTQTDKDIKVKIVGAKDYNGNIVSPNPVEVTVKKSTSDSVKPTVQDITVTSPSTFTVKFSEELFTTPTIAAVNGQAATAVKDVNDPTKYNVTLAGAVSGLQTVSITAFKDLTENAGDAYSKAVNFDADTTAPTLVSSKVEKINGVEHLVLTYNENVKPVDAIALDGTYLEDYVTKAMTTLTTETDSPVVANAPASLYKAVDGKSNSVQINLSALTKATEYTVDLDKGLVTDLYGNQSAAVNNFKFTRTSNVSTDAPEVDGVTPSLTDNNKVTVSFDRAVDGASAINTANYKIEGATIEKAELVDNSSTYDVVLTIAKNSNTASGARTVTVSGVKSQAGTAMETYTTSATFVENVLPTLTKAQLTAVDTITLTFSENVYNPATGADVDFELYVGGNKVSAATLDTEDVAQAAAKNTLTLTLSGYTLTASDIANLSVKAVSGTDIKDANDNSYAASTVTVQQ
ncbi:Ig-like domain-containing protein [Metabacillus litoralis]|uniref:Ig-like domain-containing protein n=1 Tax=Metabacillus litoralis TaxID=152268 RepID=UPI001BA33CCC|nr:Ig-like domain-containing protein [Metabacillus litoralis]UHA60644.1 Ig-like domain-containing protein [Metabacillus litoralis]